MTLVRRAFVIKRDDGAAELSLPKGTVSELCHFTKEGVTCCLLSVRF